MPNQHTTKGVPKRKRIVSVRYTDEEHGRVTESAEKHAIPMSDFIRARSLGEKPAGKRQAQRRQDP